jgi:hypothetical protein
MWYVVGAAEAAADLLVHALKTRAFYAPYSRTQVHQLESRKEFQNGSWWTSDGAIYYHESTL